MDRPGTRFLWRYLLLAYGLAWLFWIPVALSGRDYQASSLTLLLVLLGVFGPGMAGILCTYREEGLQGRRDFWRRAWDWRRVKPGWVLIILLLWPATHLLAVVLGRLAGGSAPNYAFLQEMGAQPAGIPVVIVLYMLQAGLEELGWRGYLLERLQSSMGPGSSSLLVGIFHAFWHLPLFWVAGTNQIAMGFGLDFLLYLVMVMALAVITGWCYLGNGHSTLAATLLHTTGNLCFDIFVMAPGTPKERFFVLLVALAAVGILGWWRRR